MNADLSPSLWRQALTHTLPVAMGYYPAGIAFGVLMAAADLPLWLCLLLSLTVYSGAAQYAAIPLFAAGAGVAALTLNTLIINLRHIFYGIPLLDAAPNQRWQRVYAFFALTDECFSVMTTLPEAKRKPLFARIAVLNQSYWVTASLIGFVLGDALNQVIGHLDFALACLFVMLWYEQFCHKRLFWSSMVAVSAFFLAKAVTTDYVLLLAVGLCAAVIIVQAALPARKALSANTRWLGWALAVLLPVLWFIFSPRGQDLSQPALSGTPLAAKWQIIAVLCMALVTFLLRFAPNLLPKIWFRSPYLAALNLALPLSVMTILILASVDIDGAVAGAPVMLLAQSVALFAVWWVYRRWRNVLFGMVAGVAVLNILLHFLA